MGIIIIESFCCRYQVVEETPQLREVLVNYMPRENRSRRGSYSITCWRTTERRPNTACIFKFDCRLLLEDSVSVKDLK